MSKYLSKCFKKPHTFPQVDLLTWKNGKNIDHDIETKILSDSSVSPVVHYNRFAVRFDTCEGV